MKVICILIIFIVQTSAITVQNEDTNSFHLSIPENREFSNYVSLPKSRIKRQAGIYWPAGSLFVSDFILATAFPSPYGTILPYAIQTRYNYVLPNFVFPDFTARSISSDRLQIFQGIQSYFSQFGTPGKECVLRAICEKEEFDILSTSLLGDLISAILRVTSTGGLRELNDYKIARDTGLNRGNCSEKYVCPFSIFRWLED